MPARQAQPYTNLPVQQSNINEAGTPIPSSRSQTPPNSAMVSPSASFNQIRNAQMAKPDMAAGVYRTATAAAPSVVQVPPQHQQQYVGYTTQIHQSAVPSSGGAANYAYEYAEPSHAQIYTIHSLWLRQYLLSTKP
ncbi:uncharacterized protein Pyn_39360 [Prunus yedoensis var. nudiflora]|uniref:Uncharacterized protein n=1 Tax=Prunus yedoensis var. nudiflora TaxID=2094558 RepID=A0A314XY85_PRUYE|nr:uncharacterized protein Pyn_39360 [Prunus yedoensis var. nudiflora]